MAEVMEPTESVTRKERKTYQRIEKLFKKNIVNGQVRENGELLFLRALVGLFRPMRITPKTRVSLQPLLTYLENNPAQATAFSEYLKQLLSGRKFRRMVSDAGILQDSDFMYEVKKRFWAKLLPYQPEKDTYEYILNQVFYSSEDAKWVQRIPEEELFSLFNQMSFKDFFGNRKQNSIFEELLKSVELLTQRMSGRAMESPIIRMLPEYSHEENPFLALEKEFLQIEKALLEEKKEWFTEQDSSIRQFFVFFNQCQKFINHAFKNSAKFGISIRVNQGLLRLRQQLQRTEKLLSLIVVNPNMPTESKIKNTIRLGLQLIEYNCYKYNLKGLIKESTQLISYEITQYTAKTGEHYITSTPSEYWNMFRTAMGAGIIVGFMCITKIYAHHVSASDFGHAFLYSLNYAAGFVLIYLTGCTLATKQPAMTAATLIKVIEEGRKKSDDSGEKFIAFAKYFARLFRSQFIAFIGNVILAFPVALGLVWSIEMFTGNNLTSDSWVNFLTDASPVHSKAIFHAGIAGIFLFLSGIIAGKVANNNKHNNVYYRIQEHPWLKYTFGNNTAKRLAGWVEKKWPGVVSNIWFGIFMGSCGILGAFVGLDIDIRHITFVSGNVALGWYGSGYEAPAYLMFWAVIGIWVVGMMNFLVSFSMSLLLAFRSRNIPFREVTDLTKSTWTYFKTFPYEFFLPPAKEVQKDT